MRFFPLFELIPVFPPTEESPWASNVEGRFIKLNNPTIGKIPSSTWSPYQVCGVGIVLLDKADIGPGSVVEVECTDEKIHKAELCELPMYDPKGEIVRGINKNIPTKAKPWAGIKS